MADESKAFCLELLDRAGIRVGGDEPWDIQVHDERLWRRVLVDRELGLGESYQEGWWDAARPDELIARLLQADVRALLRSRLNARLLGYAARSAFLNLQTVRRARANAAAHYGIGLDLFERMLDRRMVYSCAYWRDADDLDAAQEAKLDLICRKLHLEPGMTVLDVGCGWGGFARFAAERYGVEVRGISPAADQVRVARERCAGLPVRIDQLDYREVDGTYDRIVSVGMLEHVGVGNLDRFVRACDERLAPDGLMLHHTIGSTVSKRSTDAWFDKYIFPGGALPSVRQLAAAAEPGWAFEDLHNFGPDYDRTLMAWHANVEAAWPDLPGYDERFRRTWRYYLLVSAAGFRVHGLQLWQIVLRRAGRPVATYEAVR